MENGQNFEDIWKSKIPEKVNFFMWLVVQSGILSKDNILKRKC
jgi:hypothetical protein